MTRSLALIVDDEPDIRELIEITLARMEVESVSVSTIGEAHSAMREHPVNLCLTDMRLPDGSGIDLVRFTQQHFPDVPIAMITAHGSMDSAVEALKAGAFDFVAKPVDLQVLRNLVHTALRLGDRETGSSRALIGESPVIEETRAKIRKLARSQAPVYISGESGTGKELVARMIHEGGPRAEGMFVPVNCGAIPAELMESELFGHKRGSFTGATADKRGLFQAAAGGTLFFDEVAELPLHMQVKLLRAIQEKSVRAVGAESEVPVDVRILSASHKSLEDLVRASSFRQDLYYRLNVIQLHVPALRERGEDILRLAAHILARLAATAGVETPTLSDAARARLIEYGFPGNVRELENVLERAMTLCDREEIEVGDLGLETPLEEPEAPADDDGRSLDEVLEGIEKETIRDALEKSRWNKTAAAKRLGISFGALRYRMQKLGLDQ